ncbi:MAG TPA: sialidase family protein, partial [Gaiellaceae bacterium]|nr:sialidase family protein [Gaiellaceae bacterium]
MTKARFALLLAVAAFLGLFFAAAVRAEPPGGEGEGGEKEPFVRTVPPGAQHGWVFECTAPVAGPNGTLDCDDPFPNNEPNIVVDRSNPLHMIASSNDYGSCCDEYYTSFNGGATWSTGNMSVEDPKRTGSDPVTAIDVKHGVALHASLNYKFRPDGEACDGDVVVSPSHDGGLSWKKPAKVGFGNGCDLDKLQVFNDKEWIATDNNPASPFYGRTYVTWTAFVSHSGEYVESPIMESHSDDGGGHWTEPKEISGSNGSVCTFQSEGSAGQCDEDQASVITTSPDGTVYVAFMNSQNEAIWEP